MWKGKCISVNQSLPDWMLGIAQGSPYKGSALASAGPSALLTPVLGFPWGWECGFPCYLSGDARQPQHGVTAAPGAVLVQALSAPVGH